MVKIAYIFLTQLPLQGEKMFDDGKTRRRYIHYHHEIFSWVAAFPKRVIVKDSVPER